MSVNDFVDMSNTELEANLNGNPAAAFHLGKNLLNGVDHTVLYTVKDGARIAEIHAIKIDNDPEKGLALVKAAAAGNLHIAKLFLKQLEHAPVRKDKTAQAPKFAEAHA